MLQARCKARILLVRTSSPTRGRRGRVLLVRSLAPMPMPFAGKGVLPKFQSPNTFLTSPGQSSTSKPFFMNSASAIRSSPKPKHAVCAG